MTPLHYFGTTLREALAAVPMWCVRTLFVCSLVVLLIWVLRLPREATTPPQGVKRWDEQLKIVATISLLIQILIYAWL